MKSSKVGLSLESSTPDFFQLCNAITKFSLLVGRLGTRLSAVNFKIFFS